MDAPHCVAEVGGASVQSRVQKFLAIGFRLHVSCSVHLLCHEIANNLQCLDRTFVKPAALENVLLFITVHKPTCSLHVRDRQTPVVCSANRSGRRDACLACVAAGAIRPDSQAATDLASVFCCVKQALPFSSGPGAVRSRTCVRVITASRESGVCRPKYVPTHNSLCGSSTWSITCRENSSGSAFRPQTAAISASPCSCSWPAISTASMGSHNR